MSDNTLFGAGSMTQSMRGGLTELSATHATIAARIAAAQGESTVDGFGGQLESAMAQQEAELNRNMTSLADTEIRYDALTRILQKSYTDFRTAMRNG